MFDTVEFRLTKSEYNGVGFLSEIPCYITDVSLHNYIYGDVVAGSLGNLNVSCSEYQIKISGGS